MNEQELMESYEEGPVVHWAGEPVCIKGRVIQRCKVCGAKLLDNMGPTDWAVFRMQDKDQVTNAMAIQHWAYGAWILQWKGQLKVVTYPQGHYPTNGCIDLVEKDRILLPGEI